MEENITKDVEQSGLESVVQLDEHTSSNFTHPNNPPSTYIEIISEKDEAGQPISILEVDLVISREKGKETRKLSLSFAGIDLDKKEMIEKSVNIDKDNFEKLKDFFCNLDWNS